MTIEKEEPGIWVGYCDSCGERIVLDTDGDADRVEAVEELEEARGWRIEQPQKHRFKKTVGALAYSEVYEQHFCPDC